MTEAAGLLGQLHGGLDGILIGLGGKNLGVVSDEGGFHPIGARILNRKLQQFRLCALDKGSGFCQCGRFGSAGERKAGPKTKNYNQVSHPGREGLLRAWTSSSPSPS